eukprot:7547844-Heterocapsa_arctica.AAC.1
MTAGAPLPPARSTSTPLHCTILCYSITATRERAELLRSTPRRSTATCQAGLLFACCARS